MIDHSKCDHPKTKAGRAKCRKDRAKAAAPEIEKAAPAAPTPTVEDDAPLTLADLPTADLDAECIRIPDEIEELEDASDPEVIAQDEAKPAKAPRRSRRAKADVA
jgi:hypothetical protein